ncbi:hypothetical protein K4L44_10080 [Halosquirtibacter laminarini]|uniref:Uncharacterized protein n=1 Tax=Halosquirtibacter laminarini TaxID=3374600 RepID=A0AC61NBT0_9BACT|nr:hypothetical protein K4L44_10080 [Prolixibacteraceae bacterium]
MKKIFTTPKKYTFVFALLLLSTFSWAQESQSMPSQSNMNRSMLSDGMFYNYFTPYYLSPNILIEKDSIGKNDMVMEVGTYFQTDFDHFNELGVYVSPYIQGRLSKNLVYTLQPTISNHNLWMTGSNKLPSGMNMSSYANFQQIGGSAFLGYEINEHFEVGAGIYGSAAFSNSREMQQVINNMHQIGASVYTRYKTDNFSFTMQFDYSKVPTYTMPIRQNNLDLPRTKR